MYVRISGRVFYDKSLDSAIRVHLLKILCVAALKDDVILLLHQDRREHTIMNFAYDIDRHPIEEQLPLAQFVSNLNYTLSDDKKLIVLYEFIIGRQSIRESQRIRVVDVYI